MFTHLTKPLAKGETVKATFTFEHAGAGRGRVPGRGLGAAGAAPMKGGAMGGMKM